MCGKLRQAVLASRPEGARLFEEGRVLSCTLDPNFRIRESSAQIRISISESVQGRFNAGIRADCDTLVQSLSGKSRFYFHSPQF